MSIVSLTFSGSCNFSARVGDNVYYASTPSTTGGFNTVDVSGEASIVLFGTIDNIDYQTPSAGFTIDVDKNANAANPTSGDFIFFSKDNEINITSLKGYYGSITLKNNAVNKAELFAVTCGVVESSQ